MTVQASARLRALLAHRALPFAAAAVACALASPSLTSGLATDDYVQRAWVRALPGTAPGCLDLFHWASGSPVELGRARWVGLVPWWASPHLKLAFLRPLASATHCLDYRAWPSAIGWMHAENLLAYGLLVLAVAALYRAATPSRATAGLAALLFALNDAHGLTLGWIANRNALLATLFVAVAGLAGLRALRPEGRARDSAFAALATLGALASSEVGIAAVVYLACLALFASGAPTSRRVRAVAPSVVAALGWVALRAALGYGTGSTSAYLGLAHASLATARELASRVVVLLSAAAFKWPDSDAWVRLGPTEGAAITAQAAIALALLALVLVPVLRARPVARAFALGTLAMSVGAAIAPPSDRLLLVLDVGVAAVLAEAVAWGCERVERRVGGSLQRALLASFVAAVLVLHVGVAAARMPARSRAIPDAAKLIRRASRDLHPSGARDERAFVLRGPEAFACTFAIGLGYLEDGPRPRADLCLSAGPSPLVVRRHDAHTLALAPAGGFLDNPYNRVHRGPAERSRAGDRIDLDGVSAIVTRVDDAGQPMEALFHFSEPLDSASARWLVWDVDRYVVADLPREDGAELTLTARYAR